MNGITELEWYDLEKAKMAPRRGKISQVMVFFSVLELGAQHDGLPITLPLSLVSVGLQSPPPITHPRSECRKKAFRHINGGFGESECKNTK